MNQVIIMLVWFLIFKSVDSKKRLGVFVHNWAFNNLSYTDSLKQSSSSVVFIRLVLMLKILLNKFLTMLFINYILFILFKNFIIVENSSLNEKKRYYNIFIFLWVSITRNVV